MTARLFFAIFPDSDTAAKIAALAAALRERHGLEGRPLPADMLHATVCYLGTFPELPVPLLGAAKVAASRLESAPVPIAFDTVASFDSRRRRYPLVLRGGNNAPLRALHHALTAALSATRAIAAPEPFEPHVTLLRDRRLLPAEAVAPVAWTATGLALVHSIVPERRYEILDRWTFAAT